MFAKLEDYELLFTVRLIKYEILEKIGFSIE